MKQLLLTLISISAFTCNMVANSSFWHEGKRWVLDKTYPAVSQELLTIYVCGDTIVNDIKCKKVYQQDNISGNKRLAAFGFQTGKKIYCYYPGSTTPELLYDFGLRKGDKFLFSNEIACIVENTDYVSFYENNLKRWHIMDNSTKDDMGYWIENIGSTKGPLSPLALPGNYYQLNYCMVDDAIIYKSGATQDNTSSTSFLVEDRTWNYVQTTIDEYSGNIEEKDFCLTIKGITTFKDVACNEIYYTDINGESLYGYAYEDEGKVYFWFLKDIENFCTASTDWEQVFDFNKKESEIFNSAFPSYLAAKDYIEVKGREYNRYWIGPKYKDEIIKLYPVIPSIGGFGGLHNNTFERTGKSPSYTFKSVYDGQKCIFERNDFFVSAKGANNNTLAKEKTWNYSYGSVFGARGEKNSISLRMQQPYSLFTNGDTTVAGRACKKIYHELAPTRYVVPLNEYFNDTLYVPNDITTLHGYMHEAADSVSFFIENSIFGVESPKAGKWIKMYDYTASSSTYCGWLDETSWNGYYMLAEDEAVIQGRTRKIYLVYGGSKSIYKGAFPVIPGIGCGGLYFAPMRIGSSMFSLSFNSVYEGDKCIFKWKDYLDLFDKYFGKYAAVSLGNEPMESQLDYNHENVSHLWVWGKPQPADYEYLRDNRLAGLSYLDMRNADIDTVPTKAFYTTISNNKRIILPKTLKHLADSALCTVSRWAYDRDVIFELTSPTYPTLGKDVYAEKKENQEYTTMPVIVPATDNKAFVCHENVLYSADGNIAYYANIQYIDPDRATPRIINANFLENGYIPGNFYIPATVDSIGDRAFANVGLDAYRGKQYTEFLACYATTPPKLGKDVFVNSIISAGLPVYVPENSFELYRSAEGWKGLKLRSFSGNGITAIENITTNNQTHPTVFDLQGRKVKNPRQGLYISDGKKYHVR